MSRSPVTLMVSRRAADGRYEELLAWLHEGEQLATDFPGYLGSGILAPPRDGDEFQIIFRFSDEPTLHAWEHSASRRAWLKRGNGLFERPREARVSGINDWFGTALVRKQPLGNRPRRSGWHSFRCHWPLTCCSVTGWQAWTCCHACLSAPWRSPP